MKHKAGFVNIVGNPNVGKSTLTNKLVGERLSIITSKAQTTRHRILGIVNEENYQIVFSDTPGVLKPNYKLQESMLRFSKTALQDADVIIYMTDVVEKMDKNSDFLNSVRKTDSPVILVINKIDESNPEQLDGLVSKWKEELPKAEIFPMSALRGFNTDNLMKRIKELLPECDPYYDKDALTDKPTRFFVSEIIREKILLYYQKEIPYSVEIEVEEFKEGPQRVDIRAIIHVARDSQKGIIIGHQGNALKKTGTEARKDIEKFLDKKVFLQLYVKVNKDWRDKDNSLRNFGYEQK
ncbi:GTPase Era [Saccharicrinis fermentans]|uniref:GTPase Era n=1 Tax=Saccharicrinis fermentans DSM 9555 = JCM 21142 TaxID=869213 RepID=W7Y1U4_9BACT|nr:GTPase Era [Saccharicrinis fermentans]GAF01493.1 GTPase Era [Saccharicrinis fermentans DSM 9555 = JCM 21142]